MTELTLDRARVLPAGTSRLLTEKALARRAAAGNEAAFAEIFRRHHQALFRYAVSILGNDDDARDVVQQTMVALLRSLPGEEREIELRPWLFRIAHNEAISLRRRRAEAPLESVAEPTDGSPDASTRLRARALISDLAELPDRQRSAVVMRELNGLSHAEIGVALGISAGAAKQAVYEARCALQEQEEGREMGCNDAKQTLSAQDRRRLRGRKLRAHLRCCPDCRAFEATISRRREEFAAIGFMPAGVASQLLSSLFGGGGASGGGGAGGAVAGGAVALHAAGGGGAAKMLAGAVAATVAATAMSVEAINWASKDRGGNGSAVEAVAPPAVSGTGGSAASSAAEVARRAAAASRSRAAGGAGKRSGASKSSKGREGGPGAASGGKPDSAGKSGSPPGPDGAGPPGLSGSGGGPPGAPPPHAGGPHASGPPGGGPPSAPPGQNTASGKKPTLPVPAPGGKSPTVPPVLEGKDKLPKPPSLP